MDEMTQQNSALVEESTASARVLSNQASKLTELMGFFKLDRPVSHQQAQQTMPQRPTRSTPTRSNPQTERDELAMAIASDAA